MSQIYATAQRVLIWLPSDNAEEWATFEPVELRRLLAHIRSTSKIPLLRDSEKFRRDIFNRDRSPEVSAELERLGSSQWFTRVWTVQEYAFARDCLLYFSHAEPLPTSQLDGSLPGSQNQKRWHANPFRMTRIRSNARQLVELAREHGKNWNSCSPMVRETLIGYHTYMMRDLMAHSRVLHATMAVDFVFAMYPSFDAYLHRSDWRPRPTYSKTKEQVFHEATAAFIQLDGNISFLAQLPSVAPSAVQPGCPSWVPDYSIRARNARLLPFHHSRQQQTAKVSISHDLSVLSIQGFHVEPIKATLPDHKTIREVKSMEGKYRIESAWKAWHLVLRWYCLALESSRLPVATVAEQFFRTLTAWKSFEKTALLAAMVLYLVRSPANAASETPFLKWYNESYPALSKRSQWNKDWTKADRTRFFTHFGPLRHEVLEDHAAALEKISTFYVGTISPTAYPGLQALRSLLHTDYGPEQILFQLSDKELFVTESGLTGITIGWVLAGDALVAVESLSCLAVVRQNDQKDGYQWVGIAAVHGLNPLEREKGVWQKSEVARMQRIDLV